MSRAAEESNRRLLRARDATDRADARPLDVPALARIAHVSEARFSRTFRAIVGEPPTAYRAHAPSPAREEGRRRLRRGPLELCPRRARVRPRRAQVEVIWGHGGRTHPFHRAGGRFCRLRRG